MGKKKIVWVDMDDTCCDYTSQIEKYSKLYPEVPYPQSVIGFFSGLKVIDGFLESWKFLSKFYDMRILSRPSPYNINSATEKLQWVRDNIGFEAMNVTHLGPDKSAYIGDFLVDDGDIHGQKEFKGEHLQFGKDERFMSWDQVSGYLLGKVLMDR